MDSVEVGNAYVNRHITGAVVQRQPFGGWKRSVVGPAAKPGGPNYVAQFGKWSDESSRVPRELRLIPAVCAVLATAARRLSTADATWLRSAAASDELAWGEVFGIAHDPTGLRVEANILRYRPLPRLDLLAASGATRRDVWRVVLAAARTGTTVHFYGIDEIGESLLELKEIVKESEPVVRPGGRLRILGEAPDWVLARAAELGASVLDAKPLNAGRRELLTVLREQSISMPRHRYGHLIPDSDLPLIARHN